MLLIHIMQVISLHYWSYKFTLTKFTKPRVSYLCWFRAVVKLSLQEWLSLRGNAEIEENVLQVELCWSKGEETKIY